MPLDFEKSDDSFRLGIWRMDESLVQMRGMLQLSGNDEVTLNNFKSEYRKHEWLTTRVLVKNLLPAGNDVSIQYDKNGKPQLPGSIYSLSISHTKNFVAVLLAKSKSAGIDLETIQPRIEKLAKRFMTSEEAQFIDQEKKISYQHVIWGTKEVLYKIYGKGELDFLENLHSDKFIFQEKGTLTGRIVKNNFRKEYTVFYEKLNHMMLVYAFSD